MNIQVYYDGTDVENNSGENIQGFTTNISFMKNSGITDYEDFIKDCLKYSKGRPISFQLFDDDDEGIEKTARKITGYDDSIFVKIPVIKTDNSFNCRVINKLHNDGLKINVTAIFTKEQVDSLVGCFNQETDVIISIFSGRMNDCGVDSSELVAHAKKLFADYDNVKVLWAACRTVYNVLEAEKQGADIVTVPDSVLNRMHRLQENCHDASLGAVQTFRQDGLNGNIFFK